MVQQELHTILNKYEKTDSVYYDLLSRIMMFCADNFLPLIKQAEAENKRIFIKTDSQAEAIEMGISSDGTIYLEDLAIR